MRRRFLSWFLIPVLLISFTSRAFARLDQGSSNATALIAVSITSAQDLEEFKLTGLSVFTRWPTEMGEIILTGADPDALLRLTKSGLSYQYLDEDISRNTYYLVYAAPGEATPDLRSVGQVLFVDTGKVLLRADPAAIQQIIGLGGHARAISLDPKPLIANFPQYKTPTLLNPDPVVQDMINAVDASTVYTYSGNLTGLWPVLIDGAPYTITTRYTYSGEPIEKATHLVGTHMENLGLDVEYHEWGPTSAPNVVGELRGTTHPEIIYILSAHLDNIVWNSEVAPGMDDNASGTVAVLIAADILSQYEWDCTLRFAFWTGEEMGLLGSHAYVQRAAEASENILGALNLDMIAYNTAGTDPTMDLHTNSLLPQTLELAELFVDVVDTYDINLIPEIIPNGTNRSDHASFWDYGYTAILGIEAFDGLEDFNPNYHTIDDTYANLQDIPYFIENIKGAVATYAHLADCQITNTYFPVVLEAGLDGAFPKSEKILTSSEFGQ